LGFIFGEIVEKLGDGTGQHVDLTTSNELHLLFQSNNKENTTIYTEIDT
jgi:hypothetical protein